jgi:hypothetical protein
MGFRPKRTWARRGIFFGTLGAVLVLCVLFHPWITSADFVFSVTDGRSSSWVPNLRVVLGDRVASSTFGGNFTFRDLKPGTYTARLEAPSYEPLSFTVSLKRGLNKVSKPITLKGMDIPGLYAFSVLEIPSGPTVVLEIRPLDAQGRVINRHPCLDLAVGLRVSRQYSKGVPAGRPQEAGAERGEIVFYGMLPWEWQADLTATSRYRCVLPERIVEMLGEGLYVFDYLLLVQKGPQGFPDSLKAQLSSIGDAEGFMSLAEASGGSVYQVTNWNVNIR